jgi:ubiquitin-protein ligase
MELVIEVVSEAMSLKRRRKVEIPQDALRMKVSDFISALITKLGLPTADPSGLAIGYRMDIKRTKKMLGEEETLENAGVRDGDELRLYTEITAGASVRDKRLQNDYEKMRELREKSPFIDFKVEGNPPEKYIVTFTCKGLVKKGERIVNSIHHMVEIYLPVEYPTKSPQLTWLTPIFHPNILGNDHKWHPGKVCLGGWTPSQFLDELCIKLGEMIQYKNYGLFSPLNTEAAVWAKQNRDKLPVDMRDLVKEIEIEIKEVEEFGVEDIRILD